MLKKRLIGVVTVKDGWAVQSFGYRRYLPLGRPEVLVQNLDRWGADEILVQCIDRSVAGLGPDFDVLGKISKSRIATPLIYAGGISRREDAVKVISHGADRIMIDAMLLNYPQSLESIAHDLGTQAVIAHMAARITDDGLKVLNYRNGTERELDNWMINISWNCISEMMVCDWSHEGSQGGFDERILTEVRKIEKPILCFGGITTPSQIQRILSKPKIMAVGIGNTLNYREHAVQLLKEKLGSIEVRKPFYESTFFST